jgi:hypothetical protein
MGFVHRVISREMLKQQKLNANKHVRVPVLAIFIVMAWITAIGIVYNIARVRLGPSHTTMAQT